MATDDHNAKQFKKSMKIGTHNGAFHCDEILACFMLTRLPEYRDAEIVRTRDQKKLDECDVVVDVGGVFDPTRHRYDHHQRTFNESASSLLPGKPWTTKLSSAGLVYVHFGLRILSEMTGHPKDDRLVEMIYDKVYENFIEEVDGIDNGIDPYPEKPRYAITTNLSSRVRNFLPAWNEPERKSEECLYTRFMEALKYVGAEFTDRVESYIKIWWPARALVEEAYAKRFEIDSSGEIFCLGEAGYPWKDHILEHEETLAAKTLTKYVLYPDDCNGTWRIQCVPASVSSFENRLSLPEEWRGLRDEELTKKSGIAGCTFVHAGGFIGGNKTYSGALEMARQALQITRTN